MKFTLSIEDKHGGIADEYSFDEGEFLVGRSHSADIILPSDNVSRRHARLYTIDSRCYVEDLGSANGVFLNGRRIHEVMEIEGTAQIRVGDYYLHVRSEETVQPEDKVHCRIRGLDHGVADQIFPIKRTVSLVGRGKDCTVTIIDPSVSRIHAKLTVERSGAITLEDLKSSNGTFVNDEKIEVATLSHRDSLRIGNVELMVEFPEQEVGEDTEQSSDDELAAAWTQDRGSTGKKVVMAIVATAVVLGGGIFALFSDKLTSDGGPQPAQTPSDGTPSADAVPGAAGEKAETDIELLEREGRTQIKSRNWEAAVVTWRKLLDKDPLHTDARIALNQIAIWQRDKETLDKARTASKEKRYGEAARLLRSINDLASVYLEDAKDELKRLTEMKPALVMQAEALFKSRDCAGALKLYGQAQKLDPSDATLDDRIKIVKKKEKTKCR